jgi:antitoxin component YwqK of YwqJK toxin-antitoxin module
MKKLFFFGFWIMSYIILPAQSAKYVDGFYFDTKGNLFTGILEIKDEKGNKTASLTIKDGLQHGEANYFYVSGNRMESGAFEMGLKAGLWIRFNENGKKMASGSYLGGKKNGQWLVWDEKGNLRFEMQYSGGQKVGVWNSFDENGALVASNDFGNLN